MKIDDTRSLKKEMLFKKYYPVLDLLRVVAISLVMLRHFTDRAFLMPPQYLISKFIMWGAKGVLLFFVLSGFLIGGQIMEELLNGSFSFKKFFFKRLWRIFPPYYFAILVASLLYIFNAGAVGFPYPRNLYNFIADIIYHLSYLQIYSSAKYFTEVYWSLSVEEHFYLLSPILLYLAFRYARKYIAISIIILILLGIFMRMLIFHQLGAQAGVFLKIPLEPGFQTLPSIAKIPLLLLYLFDGLIFGVFTAYLFIRYNKKLRAVSLLGKVAMLITSLVILGFCVFYKINLTRSSYLDMVWGSAITSFGFSLLLLSGVILPLERIIRPRKILSYIAKRSYTLYLYHIMLLLPFFKITRRYFVVTGFSSFIFLFVLYYLVALVISASIYALIDGPCMNYRRKILSRW